MAFHTRKYETFCFLGDPKAKPLWQWKEWKKVLPSLDAVVAAARDRAAVRSNQYLPNQGGTVKLGRIGWNTKGQEKWTHGPPTNHEPGIPSKKRTPYGSHSLTQRLAPLPTLSILRSALLDRFPLMPNEEA